MFIFLFPVKKFKKEAQESIKVRYAGLVESLFMMINVELTLFDVFNSV